MIDFRTIFLIFGLVSIAGAFVTYLLWAEEGSKHNGLNWFLISFTGQSVSLILVFLRGYIPDLLSVVLMNFVTIFSVIAILIGIKKFYNIAIVYWPLVLLLLVHVALQSWFTFGNPNLHYRNLIISISYLIVSFNILWVLITSLGPEERRQTTVIVFAFLLYCIIDTVRVFYYLSKNQVLDDYLKSGTFELGVMLAYFFSYLLQLFGIITMVNRYLQFEMKLANEKFFKVFNHSQNAIILSRKSDGLIVEVNKGLELMAGLTATDCLGKTTLELGFWADINERNKLLKILVEEGHVRNFETIFKKSDGTTFSAYISADPINFNNDLYILSTIQDISAEKALVNQLNHKTQELTKLNASKDKFLSIIAHDLKGPFNNVLALTTLLAGNVDKKETPELENFVQMIHKSANKAMELLLNLLDWARISTGRMEYTPEIIEACGLIYSELELAELAATKKKIKLVNECHDQCLVNADSNMLSAVFRNLISNSIKFTAEGGEVRVMCKYIGNKVRFTISDTGVGMNKAKLEKLFILDANISTLGTNQESGTGLGLLLCKEYLEKHGSEINVSSVEGTGTQISFDLEMAK